MVSLGNYKSQLSLSKDYFGWELTYPMTSIAKSVLI